MASKIGKLREAEVALVHGGAHEGNTSRYSWRINLPNSALRLSVPLLQFRFNWAGLPKSCGVQRH